MSDFTYTTKNQEEALKINGGKKFTSEETLKYQDVNAIVELLLKVKNKISSKRLRQLNIAKENLKGGLYSYDPFDFVMIKNETSLSEVGFFFDTGEKRLFADVDITSDVKYDVTINSNNGKYCTIIYLVETEKLRDSLTENEIKIPYKINFYLDLAKTILFTSINGTMKYKG